MNEIAQHGAKVLIWAQHGNDMDCFVASKQVYSNTITTLEISPEQTQIKNEEEILYSQCVEKKDGT